MRSFRRQNPLADTEQRYNFTCPNCSGNFLIQLDRIPPVQARFRCPHCNEPMDFPSREEARMHIRLQAEGKGVSAPAPASVTPDPAGLPASDNSPEATAAEGLRFRIDKPGFESDVFDRTGVRNLIRTREVLETDRIQVDDSDPVPASDLPYLKSLFSLAKAQRVQPPTCCRTHTEKVAFFRCHDSGRPLCEKCAPEKKFGGATIRVCLHCGGTAQDIHAA
jgi:predicted Zn finger-like uncharacterized protein